MKKPIRLSVTLVVPEGATTADAKEYVALAVRGWAGSLVPSEDPMANLDAKTVEVRRYKRRKCGSLKRQATTPPST
jgi:hypothetical protein